MPGRLADHHLLDQVTDDRHQPLLGMFIGVVAGEVDQLAEPENPTHDLSLGWIDIPQSFDPVRRVIGGQR